MKASPNITARLGLISIPSEIRKDTPPRKASKTAWELPETPHFFGESLDAGYEKKKKKKKTNKQTERRSRKDQDPFEEDRVKCSLPANGLTNLQTPT
jgi:hypothetical protein